MISRFARLLWLGLLLAFAPQAASAQTAQAVIAEASQAMGIEGLNSIKMWGVAANYTVGQNNNSEGPFPRNNLNDFNRWIDFSVPATRATAVTFGVPVTGGPAAQGPFTQFAGPTNLSWGQHLEIWTTPWGFLKGAQANGATLSRRTRDGVAYRVLTWSPPQKSPAGQSYRVIGYIGPDKLVHKVETWVEAPIFGDLLVETMFDNYRDLGGLKFPSTILQKRAGWPAFEAQLLGVQANPSDIAQRVAPPTPPPGAVPGGATPVGFAGGPPPAASEQLAPGVWRIRGAYNALAVEFADHVVLFEPGPQNEDRARAIIAETRRVIPNKPIRYGVISHHHFDHTSGLPAVVAEGITIVTPKVNQRFFERAFANPRTLAPDAIGTSGRKAVIEGFTGDKRVFQDATRTFEIHVIKGLPHADGLVIGYLPNERILVYADMFNLPPAASPVPNPPVLGTQIFLANIERLGLQPERIMSIHSLNPDRLTSVADIRASLGLNPVIPTITAFETSPDEGQGQARDMRVRWALEEVGQPYAVRLVSFRQMKQPAHLAIQPFGQIPTYEEGDLALFETGAIVLHIAQHHAGLLPEDADARARAVTWMFAAVNTIEPPILEREAAEYLEGDKPWYQERLPLIDDRIRARFHQLAARLGDADWLNGDFSAGDLMMVAVLRRQEGSEVLGEFPTLTAYIARAVARPAYQRAFADQLAVFEDHDGAG